MDSRRDIPKDIIDISYIRKCHDDFNSRIFAQIRDHAKKKCFGTTMSNFGAIVSCYKTKEAFLTPGMSILMSSFRSSHELYQFLFPLWILPAFLPYYHSITIAQVEVASCTVAQLKKTWQWYGIMEPHFCKSPGIEISSLTVVPGPGQGSNLLDDNNLKETLKEFHIFCKETIKIRDNFSIDRLQNFSCIRETKSTCQSPHVMYGSCCGIGDIIQPPPLYNQFDGDKILIATLGYGYNKWPFCNSNEKREFIVKDVMRPGALHTSKQMLIEDTNSTVYDYWLTSPWIVHAYTKTSSFVICRTTDDDGIIIAGATAECFEKLRKKWEEWKSVFDNFVILIPYGGQYMKDEMEQITKATDEGIIVVCAAGDCGEGGGGHVVFPAALGTVISVGVAGTGPKGREIDVSVDFAIRPAKLQRNDGGLVNLPADCGIAAARITGLLSLLLSYINKVLSNPPSGGQVLVDYIKGCYHDCINTYIIRELLVSEGYGHDPQLGYGDGEDIINKFLDMDGCALLKSLACVLLQSHEITFFPLQTRDASVVEAEAKKMKCYGLDGDGVTVAVVDFHAKESCTWMGRYGTTFREFSQFTPHGDQCAAIISEMCPKACILRADRTCTKNMMSLLFDDCREDNNVNTRPSIDVISCSIFSPFNPDLCAAVNEAVIAGKIIVFAAGNHGQSRCNTIDYPGRIGNVIVVGGRDPYHNRMDFSAVGREIDFLADGQIVGKPFGTSFAAPVVAGYIAAILQFIKSEMSKIEIEAWDIDNSSQKYTWKKISILEAAHNVYAMRSLLKLFVTKPGIHSEKVGFGCLDFCKLFPSIVNDTSVQDESLEDESLKFTESLEDKSLIVMSLEDESLEDESLEDMLKSLKDMNVKNKSVEDDNKAIKTFIKEDAKRKICETLQDFYKQH